MHQLFVEYRPQSGGGLSGDLAKHLYGRLLRGKVAIVCDRPQPFMSVVRKQWLKICRQVQRERASTLDAPKVLELTRVLGHMQAMGFTAKPLDEIEADVHFATAAQFVANAPFCHTLYVAGGISDKQLRLATSAMPPGGLVVIYRTI